MKVFLLPDLGEGLADAEIIQWHVAEGHSIRLDEPLVSMETAKAVVEVPSPYDGVVARLYGQTGDIIETGKPLAAFMIEGEKVEKPGTDQGTVVGSVETSDSVYRERPATLGAIKVTPAVRALARKLGVDLATLTPSGNNGVITRKDVELAASKPLPEASPVPAAAGGGDWQPIRGTRRSMARVMAQSHAQVVPTSIMDDADIHLWTDGQDMTVRLLRAMWAGARAEPGLNAWFDAAQNRRLIHPGMDVGMAIDTADGLFAASLRNVHERSADDLRSAIRQLRENVENRSIPPADLDGYTIMLSNFGMLAGRYATPVLTPPCVAIVAAGRAREEIKPATGGYEVHRILPLSLSFDHRACTGGEAARFLKAMLDDLALPA